MTKWLLIGALLLAPVVCRADVNEFADVPRTHWSMSAILQLNRWVGHPVVSINETPGRLLTRYEMAVGTARAIDKFGYNPASKDHIDGLAVRDVLVALVFEYRDELARLTVRDPMTTGIVEIEDYEAYKEAHKHLSASQWYVHFQGRPWTKVVHPLGYRGKMAQAQKVTPPPRLSITPSMIPKFTEQDRIAREKELEKARNAHEEYLKKKWPQPPAGN